MSESNLTQPQWTKVPGEPADEPQAEPAAVTSVDTASDQVTDAFASALLDEPEPKPGKTISVNLGDMSLRELLAFSQGCLVRHFYPMATGVIRVAASLIRESENTDSTEMCRSLAGRLAREFLTDLASGQLHEAVHGDHVPF